MPPEEELNSALEGGSESSTATATADSGEENVLSFQIPNPKTAEALLSAPLQDVRRTLGRVLQFGVVSVRRGPQGVELVIDPRALEMLKREDREPEEEVIRAA